MKRKNSVLPSIVVKGDYKRQSIGLMGGSFNPAHEGHKMITDLALKRLRLKKVWWLVSTQNPLKSKDGMEPFKQRVEGAFNIAKNPRIIVKSIEAQFGTRFTIDTLRLLKRRFPNTRFVWIMGADNLTQFSDWKDWEKIARIVSIAVFDRPGHSLKALSGKMARRYAKYRLPERRGPSMAKLKPPAWVFHHTLLNPISATNIRNRH